MGRIGEVVKMVLNIQHVVGLDKVFHFKNCNDDTRGAMIKKNRAQTPSYV